MKKETKQLLQTMWIMIGKDAVKWLAVIGLFCGVAYGVNACGIKDKPTDKTTSKSVFNPNKANVSLFNSFAPKTR